jgi:phage-related protein
MTGLSLPDYTPVYPATKTVKPRQRIAKLPDWGIEQRDTKGQNQTSPEWSVRWILAPIEANTLDFFLAQQAKTGAWFLWTPPESLQGRFRCDDWTKQLSSCDIWEVQATFRQVFSFTLPRLGASTGYFVLSGGDLKRAISFRVINGSLSLVGNAAALVRTRPIYADTGAFVLTGTGITVARSLRLGADTGAIIVTMQPATLAYLSLGGDYFGDMAAQIWGWDRDFQVDWWGD